MPQRRSQPSAAKRPKRKTRKAKERRVESPRPLACSLAPRTAPEAPLETLLILPIPAVQMKPQGRFAQEAPPRSERSMRTGRSGRFGAPQGSRPGRTP